MTTWRFEARDLRTGALLAHDLPLGQVVWAQALAGKALQSQLTARIDLAQTVDGVSLTPGMLAATRPARTVIWAYRDEALQDGVIVWRRNRPMSARHVDLSCLGLLSYFSRRILTVTRSYTAVDQADIARDLIGWAQSQPGGDIGIVVPSSPDTGVLRDRLPIGYSYERRNIGTLVEQLASVIDGFEFSVDVTVTADEPVATFQVHYPQRGRRANQSNLLLLRSGDGSGNLWDYSLAEGADAFVTTVHGIGAGEGASMLLASHSDTSLLDQGYPLIEDYIAHKDVIESSTLVGHTQETVRRRGRVNSQWQLRVDPADVSNPFGSWIVGDEARLVIEDDDRFPAGSNGEPGLETTLRIIGQTVAIPDDGGPERVVLDAEVPLG